MFVCVYVYVCVVMCDMYMYTCTVEPLYNGHFGTTNFVRYTEVSVTWRVQRSRAYLMS